MKRTVKYISICLFLIYSGSAVFCQNKNTDSLLIKKTCLAATITAIQLEANRYQSWMDNAKQQNNSEKVVEYQITLDSLNKDLIRFQKMNALDYVLPQKRNDALKRFNTDFSPELITSKAWVEESASNNTVLYVEGMSKSGPWFHLAGIVGDNYTILKPNKKYNVTFYSVYGRNYWNMTSAYVCVISNKLKNKRIFTCNR